MKKPITVCANEKCESIIRQGQRVWHRGADLYCHSKCLLTSFGVNNDRSVLREKAVLIESQKLDRIKMMNEIFAKRKKNVVAK